ncbi:MAG: excinuclease ABC subunit C, partial [Lachnospiraceae bacterium]|nr:excinuclease ABC subunit C [Lachnospiraceae bacterium]
MKEFNLEEELKKLPEHPGVYLMHDKSDEIIYVGKAINLKNRVRQYFQTGRNRSPKIEKMITLIHYFEYIVTDSELEALVLENNLIKEYAPKYNTMLTDDKTYPFIKVTVQEPYPRVLLCRQMKRDGAKYFGPFTSAGAVRDTIDILQKLYQIRRCNRKLPREIGMERPCLYYQMKQCTAPCQGYISEEEYREHVEQVLDFLNGNIRKVTEVLETKMREAAAEFEFEKAAEYRDLIESVGHIAGKQRITNTNTNAVDRDVVAMEIRKGEAVVAIFFIRDGKLLGREHFHMAGVEESRPAAAMTAFVKQYYAGTPYVPRELLVETEVEETELLENWLSGKR